MHFQNVWRYGLMNYVECEEVSQCKWNSEANHSIKGASGFLLLAACAWRNLFPREAMWFPSSFEFDHLTGSWHHPACHVEGERMMTWHKTAWPHCHIPSGVIRRFGGLQDIFNKMFWGRHPRQGVTVTRRSLTPPSSSGCCCYELSVLVLPSHQQHPEDLDGVSPWNVGELSPLGATVCPRTFYEILSPRKLQDL